jgi:hypothetical protein
MPSFPSLRASLCWLQIVPYIPRLQLIYSPFLAASMIAVFQALFFLSNTVHRLGWVSDKEWALGIGQSPSGCVYYRVSRIAVDNTMNSTPRTVFLGLQLHPESRAHVRLTHSHTHPRTHPRVPLLPVQHQTPALRACATPDSVLWFCTTAVPPRRVRARNDTAVDDDGATGCERASEGWLETTTRIPGFWVDYEGLTG